MNKSIGGTAGLIASVCILASCTSVKLQSWTDPAYEGQKIHKVAVIGVTNSDSTRRRYEDALAGGLVEAGLEAVASYTILPHAEKLNRTELAFELSKIGVDSVIVTRSLGEREGVRYEIPTVTPDYFEGYYEFYDWSFDYVDEPGYVETYIETQLESNLYDVKSEKLIWSGRSRITDESSEMYNIKGEVAAIIKDLIKQGMIASPPKK
jgi:hypothetical protein